MKDNIITRLFKGLFKDSSPEDQPKNTHRFGLNGIIETDQGDNNKVSNEESNEIFAELTKDFIPIGKVYTGDNRVIIFSVSKDDSISEIGILDKNLGEYIPHVNDAHSLEKDKLKFSSKYPIKATYRLRRGCEDTVYWTDNNTRPKYYNFHKPELFKRSSSNNWVSSKFNLQKTYDDIPEFSDIEVLDSGGTLESGSYNFAIQYVDESLNPTEWMVTSPVIRIFNDLLTKEYGEIHGSINSDADYLNYPPSNKSIKIELSKLDRNFIYYRVAIIAANNGSGQINNVYYSEVIPTTKNSYIYTGQNHASQGTQEEILQMTNIIEKAGFIVQIENTLLLGNVQGSQAEYCNLQKFASKITADCTVKQVTLNDINDPANSKNPAHEFNGGIGYMPGEIYSFGIVYIFEDNTLSPVYHIPGKDTTDKDTVFSNVPQYNQKLYPMSIKDIKGDSTYTENNSCGNSSYWGEDFNNVPLAGKPVRHHRFPLRSEIDVPLISNEYGEEQPFKYYSLKLKLEGDIKVPKPCPANDAECEPTFVPSFNIKIEYKNGGENQYFTETVDPSYFANGDNNNYEIDLIFNSKNYTNDQFSEIKVYVADIENEYQLKGEWSSPNNSEICASLPDYMNSGELCMKIYSEQNTSLVQSKIIKSSMFGIKFSNIQKPALKDSNGLEVIGYYIVRNERTEFEKTILDSAVLFPTIENEKYISHGLLQPQTDKISSSVYAILHPEHKFKNKEYTIYDEIIQEGNYNIKDRKIGKTSYDDVYDGSSYDKEYHKDGNDDGHESDGSPTSRGFDGWSFNLISRDNIVDFEAKQDFSFTSSQIEDKFYLDALGNKTINDNKYDVFNIAADNKIGILNLKESVTIPTGNNLPYVILYKKNLDPYSNFRILPYYKETPNPVYFSDSGVSESTVYNGDSYISPMRYTNTVYWDNRVAERKGKKSLWKIILGAVVALVGAVLAFWTGGATTVVVGLGITLMGAGVLMANSGLKLAAFNKAYGEEYEKGLRQTALDSWTDMFYNYKSNIPFGFEGNGRTGEDGPSDDTIQWINECVTDLWFESSINMNLRHKFSNDVSPTFLSSPWRVESGNDTKIQTWEYFKLYYTNSNGQRYPISTLETHGARKLLAFDETRDDNRYYLGAPLGEYYSINPDYERKNTQKIHYHLPLEYDCCSDCREQFSHRWHWSEQSFQEELSDNFRIFLPNNYRDIEGETGVITNMYRLNNNLYIHTQEALWQVPKNHQERVTDQIVSFIGTGEMYSIPPRKMIDDESGNSAGCIHSEGTIKTPAGIFFVSENQNKIYRFNSEGLSPISDFGLSSWFKNNLKLEMNSRYYKLKKENYPFNNNPYNPFGTGYLMTYDSRKERIIVTKKDRVIDLQVNNSDFEIASFNNKLYIFHDVSKIIRNQEISGWSYNGIVNNTLKFSKEVLKGKIITEFKYVQGTELQNYEILDNSWTLSYSIKNNVWLFWHSYIPDFYINTPEDFFSWVHKSKYFWKHNKLGSYQNFYGSKYPFIVEYIASSNPLNTKIWDYINLNTTAKRFSSEFNEFVEERFITFNRGIFYNSRQNSGILNFLVKDIHSNNADYLVDQVMNLEGDSIIIDKTEKDWYINELRDFVIDYTKPMFKRKLEDLQGDIYLDKVLNTDVIDYEKDWTQLESFKDKYLAIRLIFDNFDDVKLLLNYSVDYENQSYS